MLSSNPLLLMVDSIEIRMKRGRAIFMGVYLLVVLLALNAFTFLTGRWDDNPVFQFFVVVIDAVFAYNLFKLSLRVKENKPVITISQNGIITNYRGETNDYKWTEITKLEVNLTGRYRNLSIESAKGNSVTDITGLEKTPEEIETMVKKYSQNQNAQ